MARIDKYEPFAGGFRAPLAADWSVDDLEEIWGVGLDANGRVVKGAGNSGVKGVLVLTKALKAGKIVDVMTNGELVECGLVAGTSYYIDGTTGVVAATAPAAGVNKVYAGHTVEADRLVVRVGQVQGAA